VKRLCQILLVVVFGTFVPAHAAAAAPQEQGEGTRLLSAEIFLVIEDPAAAWVTALFRLEGEGEVVVLLADLPGQRLDQFEFQIDGENVPFTEERRSSAMRALRSGKVAGVGVVAIGYRVRNAAPAHYRFALPVPEATPTGEERSVQVTVGLPDGARFAGNSFPPLLAIDSGKYAATTLAVPGQVHIVFGDAGAALWAHQILEWTSLAVAVAILLAGWYWSRRRARSLVEAAR
jgi:hypothetical protein